MYVIKAEFYYTNTVRTTASIVANLNYEKNLPIGTYCKNKFIEKLILCSSSKPDKKLLVQTRLP